MIFSSLYREYHLEKDPTCLHALARAMMGLQSVYGIIPKVYGKGRAAKQLYDFMARYHLRYFFQLICDLQFRGDPNIRHLIIENILFWHFLCISIFVLALNTKLT